MKNQRGVTLIALVVTIIVLIILAGVAIAALTGQNGLITRSRESKKLQIEGQVRDEVTLAIQAAKVVAERQSTQSSSFSAQTNLTQETSVVKNEIVADLTSGKGYTVDTSTSGKIIITYATDAYDEACNDSDASIQVTVTVSGNSFTIPTSEYDSSTNPNGWKYTDIVA